MKAWQLCFSCLQPGHRTENCAAPKCSQCARAHHRLLCFPPKEKARPRGPVQPAVMMSNYHTTTILGTAGILIRSNTNQYVGSRALCDPGSQVSMISESCVARLRLQRQPAPVQLKGVGRSPPTKVNGEVRLRIKPSFDSEFELDVRALIVPEIGDETPAKEIPIDKWPAIQEVKPLADANFNRPGPVDVLLGAREWAAILLDGVASYGNSGTKAQRTTLGWVVFGQRLEDEAPLGCNMSRRDHPPHHNNKRD